MNTPGCHINSAIVKNVLEKANNDKEDVTLIFLAVEKVYVNK